MLQCLDPSRAPPETGSSIVERHTVPVRRRVKSLISQVCDGANKRLSHKPVLRR